MREKGAPHSICVKIKSFDFFHFFKAVLLLEIHKQFHAIYYKHVSVLNL